MREIKLHLQIVVLEGCVLLGIEHFKQRCGRVAAEVRANLVDLVQHEDRVLCPRRLDPLRNAARERADVGASVPADLRLIVESAEAHAHELAPHRLCDGLAERGLPYARRPCEAEDRALHLWCELAHREVLNDALLHLLQAVVIIAEHLRRFRDLNAILCCHVPRHGNEPINISSNHANLRRSGRDSRHTVKLLERA